MSEATEDLRPALEATALAPGSIVVLYLANPAEKYWGVLHSLSAAGITLRGLHLSSFEEWLNSIVRQEDQFVSPSTTFFPLLRVERITLDEPLVGVESMKQRFERLTGRSVEEALARQSARPMQSDQNST